MQSVNCKKIHSGRCQTIAAYKASAEQLITVRIFEKVNSFATDNVRDNCYLHIRLLPTHLHLASTVFIHLLPIAMSADPHICL